MIYVIYIVGTMEKNILSGLGTVAGSVGGMSGYDVRRGPFGMTIQRFLGKILLSK